MGRKSRVPDGWTSLNGLIEEHRGSHDVDLAVFVADLGAIEVMRMGPDRALSIRSDDVPDWIRWLGWWAGRPTRPRYRKVRSDAGPARRRRKWGP